jgi:hypothetical protein
MIDGRRVLPEGWAGAAAMSGLLSPEIYRRSRFSRAIRASMNICAFASGPFVHAHSAEFRKSLSAVASIVSPAG